MPGKAANKRKMKKQGGGRNKKARTGNSKGKRSKWFDAKEIKLNDRFQEYYKRQKIIPEGQWDAFCKSLMTELPTSFRISRTSCFGKRVREYLETDRLGLRALQESELTVANSKFFAPVKLPWYPDGFGWQSSFPNRLLKKDGRLKKWRQFLMQENDNGTITRQEAVSMIPPLIIDAKPHHKVLDMCAAPGSKTAQLLEAIHLDKSGVGCNESNGMVVANDADNKRGHMLTHQIKRLKTANFMVTNKYGQCLPNLKVGPVPNVDDFSWREMPYDVMKFDRVLADVPCSGDGTLRKAPDLARKWKPQFGNNLHRIQLHIALRGYHMLNPGGQFVYSTCSFNPVENEAVVAQILRESAGRLYIVDCSDRLPGLVREPGISDWRIQDSDGEWYDNFAAVPDNRKKTLLPSFFPPTPEEVAQMNLHRCIRVLPHKQDTGGFFITLFKKRKDPKLYTSARKEAALAAKAEADALQRAKAKGKAEVKQEDEKMDVDETARTVKVDDAARAKMVKEEADMEKMEPKLAMSKKIHKNENQPYYAFATPEYAGECKMMREFFGLRPEFDLGQLFSRSPQAKNVYFLPRPIARVVSRPENQSLRIIHAGLKMFSRQQKHKHLTYECHWRFSQDCLPIIEPYVTKQRVATPIADYRMLLTHRQVNIDRTSTKFQTALGQVSSGGVLLYLDDENAEKVGQKARYISAWKYTRALQLLVSKDDTKHVLHRINHFDHIGGVEKKG